MGRFCWLAVFPFLLVSSLVAQDEAPKRVPKVVPIPRPRAAPAPQPTTVPEPQDPPPQNFVDPQLRLYFHLSPGWKLAKADGELSTFRYDARTAPRTTQLKAVAMLAFNPYPASTFSGAFFYLSMQPHSTAAACEAQTKTNPDRSLNPLPVAGMPFWRGLDEHGRICTESRDVVYTTMRKGSCLRFDLAVNTFCGGDVSGVKEMTDQELASVFRRLEGILETVEFRDASGHNIGAGSRQVAK